MTGYGSLKLFPSPAMTLVSMRPTANTLLGAWLLKIFR